MVLFMAMGAKLSVMGLYNWDNTLFNRLEIPTPFSKDFLVDMILTECADLGVRYPDWHWFERSIYVWGRTRQHEWQRIGTAIYEEYNALHNFDRHEDYTDSGTESSERTETAETDSTEHQSGSSESVTTTSVNAYNSGTGTLHDTVDNTVTPDITDTGHSEGSMVTTGSQTRGNTHTGHLYGNIGVTKSQEMLRDEIEVRGIDFYQIVLREFKERFCVLIY